MCTATILPCRGLEPRRGNITNSKLASFASFPKNLPKSLMEKRHPHQQHCPLNLPTSMNAWIVYNGSRGLQGLQDHLPDKFLSHGLGRSPYRDAFGLQCSGLLFRVEACRGPQVQIKGQTSGLELKDLHTHLGKHNNQNEGHRRIVDPSHLSLQKAHRPRCKT